MSENPIQADMNEGGPRGRNAPSPSPLGLPHAVAGQSPATTSDLSSAERSLIEAIRSLPETALRDRVHQVFGDLVFYVRNPRCQGMGAEGFPCGEPVSTCDDCHHIWDLLDTISQRLPLG